MGVGAGAHGFIGSERYSNVADVEEYVRRLVRGEDPVAMRETIDAERVRLETLWLGLRCREGIDLGAYRRDLGADLIESFPETIERLRAEGLAEVEGERFRLTRQGRVVADAVTVAFI